MYIYLVQINLRIQKQAYHTELKSPCYFDTIARVNDKNITLTHGGCTSAYFTANHEINDTRHHHACIIEKNYLLKNKKKYYYIIIIITMFDDVCHNDAR